MGGKLTCETKQLLSVIYNIKKNYNNHGYTSNTTL